MTRRFVAFAVVTTALVAFGPDLDACGDKSLSAGGIRMQRALAARYPASIIAYSPSTSRLSDAARDLKLPDTVRLVGHKYHEVGTFRELRSSIDTGQFNI